MPPTTKRAALLRTLAKQHEETAATFRELASLESDTSDADVYGSRPPYPALPGKSYRWLRDHGPKLVTLGLAERTGGARGRDVRYTVKAENVAAAIAAAVRGAQPSRAGSREPAPESNVIDIDAMIAASGYRTTKAASR